MASFRKQIVIIIIILVGTIPLGCRFIPNPPLKITQLPQETPLTTELLPTPFHPASETPTSPQKNTPTQQITSTPDYFGPEYYPNDVNPLTGLKVENVEKLDRRPVMIKVANFPPHGRPHSGLSFADIVFEHYIGEGTNRFTAIYYGQDCPKVGPIRSARLVDAQLVSMYAGIIGYAGSSYDISYEIKQALTNRAIFATDYTCPSLCNQNPESIVDVFADTALLSKYAEENRGIINQRYNLQGMVFDPKIYEGEPSGTQLTVIYNALDIGEWRYNSQNQLYQRWIEDVGQNYEVTLIPLVDKLTDKQLEFSNVIVLFANHKQITPTKHEIDLIENIDGKSMILLRDGQVLSGIWKSADRAGEHPLLFFTPEGMPLRLKPGNTWVIIMGSSSHLNNTAPGKWEVKFAMP